MIETNRENPCTIVRKCASSLEHQSAQNSDGEKDFLFSNMDFPPEEWDVFPAEDFDLASPRDPGSLGVEVMAQVRNDGRLIDHFRLALGGSDMLEASFKIKQVLNNDKIANWGFLYKLWPRDVKIRRNMTTSDWIDIQDLVASWDISIKDLDTGSEVEAGTYLAAMDALSSVKNKVSCSLRWGVCAGPDLKPYLHLQALPAACETFAGKPILKG